MSYQYPLHLRFKLIALAPQIYITDANGNELMFLRQKILPLKEDIRIYADSNKSREIFRLKADRILDFSARYHITDSATERPLGSVKHKGLRSIWKATYLISDASDRETHTITEDNPWVKVADIVLGEIPIVGMFTGYFFHPTYTAYRLANNQPVMQLVKQPSFFERYFEIHKLEDNLSDDEERLLVLSFLMKVQLERSRG
jgi:uncharacterized protein YxjI